MHSAGRVAAVLIAAVVAVGGRPSTAVAAAEDWLTPVTLSSDATEKTAVDVAADGQGNAYAVWQNGTVVRLAYRPAGGEWSVKLLTRHGRSGTSPEVAVNAKGKAVVVWMHEGSQHYIRAIQRLADGSWSTPMQVSEGKTAEYEPDVAIDGRGNAFAIWSDHYWDGNQHRLRILASRMWTSGTWSKPTTLALAPYTPREQQIAADADGNATAVWEEDAPASSVRVRSAHWHLGNGWSTTKTISTGDSVDPTVAAANGQAVASWTTYDRETGDRHVLTAQRSASGSWSSPTTLTQPGHDSLFPHVGMDAAGNAVAVWSDYSAGSNTLTIEASRRPAGGTWAPPVTLSLNRPGARDDFPTLSVNRNGNAVAAWTQINGGGVRTARMSPGGTWSAESSISTSDMTPGGADYHDAAVDDLGNAIVGWFDETEGGRVRAAQHDGGGPYTAMTQPTASGQTGTSFTVAWSAVDAFGDVAGTDVRYRSAAWNNAFGNSVAWLTNASDGSAAFTASAGSTYCFSARSTDSNGRIGPWSSERCTAAPVDDRALRPAGGWTRGTNAGYYQGTYTSTRTNGATLALDGIQGRYLALMATKCVTCGKLRVSLNGTVLRTIDLASSSTLRKQIIPIKTFSTVRSGKLAVRVVSSTGRAVYFDGVVVRR